MLGVVLVDPLRSVLLQCLVVVLSGAKFEKSNFLVVEKKHRRRLSMADELRRRAITESPRGNVAAQQVRITLYVSAGFGSSDLLIIIILISSVRLFFQG